LDIPSPFKPADEPEVAVRREYAPVHFMRILGILPKVADNDRSCLKRK
jgi:hypothetical protein